MRRLNVLHAKFELHCALNKEAESKKSPTEHRDLYRTVKVDTHVSPCCRNDCKRAFDYMKEQFLYHGDDIIDQKNGTTLASLQKLLEYMMSKSSQSTHSMFKLTDLFGSDSTTLIPSIIHFVSRTSLPVPQIQQWYQRALLGRDDEASFSFEISEIRTHSRSFVYLFIGGSQTSGEVLRNGLQVTEWRLSPISF